MPIYHYAVTSNSPDDTQTVCNTLWQY